MTLRVLLFLHAISIGYSVLATIDINLPEMEYIADHLSLEECRRLVASLHNPGFEITANLDLAERKVPDDVPCLNMLIHWNSAKGEGRGETHSILTHRLKQLKRNDLADWLSKTVFHELAQDLNRTFFNDPLQELAQPYNVNEIYRGNRNPTGKETEKTDMQYDWTPLDSICFALILVLASIITFLLVRVSWRHAFICHHVKKPEERNPQPTSQKLRNYKFKQKKRGMNKEETRILLADTSEDDIVIYSAKPKVKKERS